MGENGYRRIVANSIVLLRQKVRTEVDSRIKTTVERAALGAKVSTRGSAQLVKRNDAGRRVGNAGSLEGRRPEGVNGGREVREVTQIRRLLTRTSKALRRWSRSLLRAGRRPRKA